MGRAHRGISPLDTARKNVQELQAKERAEGRTGEAQAKSTGFVFNGNKKDLEQVRRYYDTYEELYVQLLTKVGFPYNAEFKGKIPELAGPDENTGIELLQQLRAIAEGDAEYDSQLARGLKPLSHIAEPHEHMLFKEVIRYQLINDVKRRWRRFPEASVVFDENGKPSAILPKGARTRGYRVCSNTGLLVR